LQKRKHVSNTLAPKDLLRFLMFLTAVVKRFLKISSSGCQKSEKNLVPTGCSSWIIGKCFK